MAQHDLPARNRDARTQAGAGPASAPPAGTSPAAEPVDGTCVAPRGDRYSITDLARHFAVTPRAIRFYEDSGLLFPERQGQARIYTRSDFTRLHWILRARRVGFSLADIKEMLDLYDPEDGRARQRLVTLAKCRERLDVLHRQRNDIDQIVAELETFCATLEAVDQTVERKGATADKARGRN